MGAIGRNGPLERTWTWRREVRGGSRRGTSPSARYVRDPGTVASGRSGPPGTTVARHEQARDAAWAVIGDAAAGHGGVVEALSRLRRTFLSNVKARRPKGQGESEWARIVVRGVTKVAAEGEAEPSDMCDLLGSGPSPNSQGSSGSDGVTNGTGKASGSGGVRLRPRRHWQRTTVVGRASALTRRT